MSKEMIVSVNGREKKIAILDNGKVTEFYIERGEENAGVAGNVYKGRVMRVLPGMQSAFVDIGLERDAFLYVTDFFDEEEEIERIVMEKGKKSSPEEAKREANEQIDRSRIEREKQMESVQELAEPLVATSDRTESTAGEPAQIDEPQIEAMPESKPEKGKRGRGRGRKDRDQEVQPEAEPAPIFEIEFDNSGFERISDSEDEDTGDLFKDAYMQENIIDRVRAVEFDMESIAEAEVGSLLAEVGGDSSGFERIADEDEETSAPAKGRGRAKAKAADKEKAPAKPKKPAKKAASKGKFAKPKAKKSTKKDGLEDAEASHKEADDKAEMAVRRGGRGRRKPKANGDEALDETSETSGIIEVEISEPEPQQATEDVRSERSDERPEETQPEREQTDDRPRGRDNNRDRGRRGGRGRNDRPSGDRPSDDRQNRDRQSNGGKRFDRNDRGNRAPQPTISDLLKEGQEILVQIAKEPIAKKAPASHRISLCRDVISFTCRRSSISAYRARSNLRMNAAV